MSTMARTYDLRDSLGQRIEVGDVVQVGDEFAEVIAINEVDEGTHGSTELRFEDGVEDTFPNSWNATGPWDDYRSDYTCHDVTLVSGAANNYGCH